MVAKKYNIENSQKSRQEIEEIFHQWIIGKNAERDCKIMIRSLLDGICYEPLAEEFGISVSQVKRILDKRFSRVCKHL